MTASWDRERVAALVCGAAVIMVCTAAGARVAAAQGGPPAAPPGAGGFGTIIGVADDSLHGGALGGATVLVTQLPGRTARTTGAGAFRIDSLPPGRYTLELTHPLIDSLGIRVVSDTIAVTGGAVQTVELSVPSARRIVAAVCSPLKRRLGPGVILGRVDDAVTGKPAAGAEVSVAWTETQVGTDIGVRTAPRLRVDRSGPTGTYRVCGVPTTLTATLQAQRGTARTAEVPLETTEEPLVIRMLHLPPPAVANADVNASGSGGAQPAPAGSAVIVGTVTNAGGVPVADARVSVQGTNAAASTAADGSFTITGVPPGTQAVLVRRVGYAPTQIPIDVKAAGRNPLTVRLGAYAPQLTRVDVKARAPDPLASTGFTRRKRTGLGHYLDQSDINRIRPTYTTDILRRLPGLYVYGEGPSATIATTRGYGCVSYLIDGNPVMASAGQSIDQLVNPQDVAAVEYYQQATAPLELSAGSSQGCALLVIWTKGSLKAPTSK